MRVRSGRLKGRELVYPKSGLRPTKDVTRQAIFNILGRRVRGVRVCDLYAGGGALGIEALSRGAATVVFVEQSVAVLRFLRHNVEGLEAARVVRGDVLKVLSRLRKGGAFDVVLADPPYRSGLVDSTLVRLVELDLVVPGGLYVVEHHRSESPAVPDGWVLERQGRYGDSQVSVLRRNGE